MKYVVLIADDEAEIRDLLRLYLENSGYDVLEAADGLEALAILKKEHVDLAVLDVMMPRMNGLHVLKKIRETSNIPVLVFSAKDADSDKILGLNLGADDYLTKPFAMKELLARVRAMTRRKTEYAAKKLQYGDFSLDDEKFELSCENSVRLSVKEFELLQALILNQNHEVSTQYLLEHVWDGAEEAGPDTVWLYISYLRGKLRSVASNVEIEGERGSSFRLTEAGR